jgi:guanine deaminase
MGSYTIAHEAYLKLIFHAAKHPHLPVNGVLLGKLSSPETVVIEDAIPLLHHWTSLSPMMEISLDLVSAFPQFTFGLMTGYLRSHELMRSLLE